MPDLSAPPPDALNLSSSTDIEAQLASVVDLVTKTAEAIDHNPLVAWVVPKQYRSVLDEIVKVLEAANGFLHKSP